MRNFFKEPVAVKPAPVALSVEEQEDALIASEESFHEFIKLDVENQRAMEIAAGLENLATVAGHVSEARNTDLAFFDAGLELALVGTGIGTEEIEPGLEDMQGKTISTEAVNQTVEKIWEAIKKVIANMWKQIQIFWGNLTKAAPGLKLRAEALTEKVAEMGSATAEGKTFSAGRSLKVLSVDGAVPKKGSDVIEGLSLVESITTHLYGKYKEQLIKAGKDIDAALGEFDVTSIETARSSLDAVSNAFATIHEMSEFKGVKMVKVGRDTRFNRSESVEAVHLPTDMAIFHVEAPVEENEDVLGRAERIRKSSLVVMQSSEQESKAKDKEAEMEIFATSDVVTIAERCIAICDMIVEHDAKALKSVADNIVKASDAVNKKFKAASKDEAGISSASSYVDSAMKFNVAFTTASTKFEAQVSRVAMTTVRAALSVAQSNLSQYKKDKA
jgi:hypothetical protein